MPQGVGRSGEQKKAEEKKCWMSECAERLAAQNPVNLWAILPMMGEAVMRCWGVGGEVHGDGLGGGGDDMLGCGRGGIDEVLGCGWGEVHGDGLGGGGDEVLGCGWGGGWGWVVGVWEGGGAWGWVGGRRCWGVGGEAAWERKEGGPKKNEERKGRVRNAREERE
ncbi:hypothetical protein Pcinc_038295 [Petrolisthes cinctipes]|uniref:Uncharacterized protein n=1 Tax=Petrolisthes cinctipes TaxID=88211 RepID=A0AAE1BR10_PETCI|nr:hypothetical protein Pcinc_038295 [Petrolisthes cinctipes]